MTDPAVRNFIHAVSHDLQSPLAKIITISEMLAEKLQDLDPEDREYLLRVEENGRKMKALLDELTRQHTS